MEQIGEIMGGMMNLQPRQSGCALSIRQRELATGVIERYGTFDNVLTLFAPKYQAQYVVNEHRCYFGTAPMLSHLKFAYGENAPIEWLSYQIIDLNRYSNCKMMTDYQVRSLAFAIYKDYYYLKLTEVMMFFSRVKSAEYGQLFFGSVDPIPLMGALRRFAEERADIVRKKEENDAREEREREFQARQKEYLKPDEIQALRRRLEEEWNKEENNQEQ